MRKLALVFAGGFFGALARYFLGAPLLVRVLPMLPGMRTGFPYDILAVNLSGALAMGLLYGLFEYGAAIPPDIRLALGTGFLGAYTTFSTFIYGGVQLLITGSWLAGLIYLAISIPFGVACAHAGYLLAGVISRRRRIGRRLLARWRRRRQRRAVAALLSRTGPAHPAPAQRPQPLGFGSRRPHRGARPNNGLHNARSDSPPILQDKEEV
jgi:CrcB protein